MRLLVQIILVAGFAISAIDASAYDPLKVPCDDRREPRDLEVVDAPRDRVLPIRVYLPPESAGGDPFPVVLFSHGLGGSRAICRYLGDHWSQRGYAAVFLQHPGSDSSVWREAAGPGERLAALRDAASLTNFQLRVQDVSAVLDGLAGWNNEPSHPLSGRLDLEHVGMAGHSFGAQTTQAVAGQSFPLVGRRFTDPRIRAAVVMSPGTPLGKLDVGDAFSHVSIPWLILTGTRDTVKIGGQTVESRLAVFRALPPKRAYELVLHDAEHSAFIDRPLPSDLGPRNPNHHRAILALTTAFWDAFLRADDDARAWLDGDGALHVLQERDRWQRK